MTIKLYDTDSTAKEFDAVVLCCEEQDGRYAVLLNQTLFFPESGGQSADTGTLNGLPVLDVRIAPDQTITHFLPQALKPGETVHGALDFGIRYGKMQNHSGEHIISGLIHQKYGFDNVGFHLGSEDVTLDLNGVLTRDQLDEIEDEANAVIYRNLPIIAEYPSPEALKTLSYRSKLDLSENVRIVRIEGVDVCACCAPHVVRTGEIGVIKLLDFIHYKGGIRIHMLCGSAALADYRARYRAVATIAQSLSVKQEEAAQAVLRLEEELEQQRRSFGSMKREYLTVKAGAVPQTAGNLCLFEPTLERGDMRLFANLAVNRCTGICAVFAGSDANGYAYLCVSCAVNLREFAKNLNGTLNGRGGGSEQMIQGNVMASRKEIEKFFAS